MLKLPDITKLSRDLRSNSLPDKTGNPFEMPSDVQVFAMREEDRKSKQQV
jgi:hypothetical protein